jgi:DNA-binding response OmpR family regulator
MAGERIVLIEDDDRIGSALLRALIANGYAAQWAQSGRSGIDAVQSSPTKLVLLDLGLPDIDGLDVCRRIHQINASIDVIMLTARDDELDIVVGLDVGAVDYVTKPFKLAELTARIRAQLRRVDHHPSAARQVGVVRVDVLARRVWLTDEEVVLRSKEFDLLARLVLDAGNVVSRETLMTDVWDEHWFGSTKTLDFHIAALRRRLDAPGVTSMISTVRGVGFRFELP